jgi:hypothetical protein
MSIRGKFFAATYDHQMKKVEKAGLTSLRHTLLTHAKGRVLEIGGETGSNRTTSGRRCRPTAGAARDSPCPSSRRPSPLPRARPLGEPKEARKQDRMNWVNQLAVLCDCNRPTLDTIREAGFAVTSLERSTIPKVPRFVRPAVVGTATAMKKGRRRRPP